MGSLQSTLPSPSKCGGGGGGRPPSWSDLQKWCDDATDASTLLGRGRARSRDEGDDNPSPSSSAAPGERSVKEDGDGSRGRDDGGDRPSSESSGAEDGYVSVSRAAGIRHYDHFVPVVRRDVLPAAPCGPSGGRGFATTGKDCVNFSIVGRPCQIYVLARVRRDDGGEDDGGEEDGGGYVLYDVLTLPEFSQIRSLLGRLREVLLVGAQSDRAPVPAGGGECQICMDAGNEVIFPCGHGCCRKCAALWLGEAGTCFVCRGDVGGRGGPDDECWQLETRTEADVAAEVREVQERLARIVARCSAGADARREMIGISREAGPAVVDPSDAWS